MRMRKFNRGEPIGEPKRVLIGNETVGRYVLPRSVLLTFFILFTALHGKAEELYGRLLQISPASKAYPDWIAECEGSFLVLKNKHRF